MSVAAPSPTSSADESCAASFSIEALLERTRIALASTLNDIARVHGDAAEAHEHLRACEATAHAALSAMFLAAHNAVSVVEAHDVRKNESDAVVLETLHETLSSKSLQQTRDAAAAAASVDADASAAFVDADSAASLHKDAGSAPLEVDTTRHRWMRSLLDAVARRDPTQVAVLSHDLRWFPHPSRAFFHFILKQELIPASEVVSSVREAEAVQASLTTLTNIDVVCYEAIKLEEFTLKLVTAFKFFPDVPHMAVQHVWHADSKRVAAHVCRTAQVRVVSRIPRGGTKEEAALDLVSSAGVTGDALPLNARETIDAVLWGPRSTSCDLVCSKYHDGPIVLIESESLRNWLVVQQPSRLHACIGSGVPLVYVIQWGADPAKRLYVARTLPLHHVLMQKSWFLREIS
jgi:hypothetical protein